MKLTDSIIKAAKPKDKRYNLPDGKGLALWVQPDGQKKADTEISVSQPQAAAMFECYFLKSLIICFITMKIIPTVIKHRINANRAFVATKKVQTLKNSSHGHSKKVIATIS